VSAGILLIGWLAVVSAPAIVCPLENGIAAPQQECETLASGVKGYAILQDSDAVLVRWPTVHPPGYPPEHPLGADLWIARDWVTLQKLPPGSYVPPCMFGPYSGEGCGHSTKGYR
jgi:hypothetical protein